MNIQTILMRNAVVINFYQIDSGTLLGEKMTVGITDTIENQKPFYIEKGFCNFLG
jgi:hypothetical protein